MKNVVVQSFSSRLEAELAKGLLEANNITASIRADDAGGMYPSLSSGEGVYLVVERKDVKKAQELLKGDKR